MKDQSHLFKKKFKVVNKNKLNNKVYHSLKDKYKILNNKNNYNKNLSKVLSKIKISKRLPTIGPVSITKII